MAVSLGGSGALRRPCGSLALGLGYPPEAALGASGAEAERGGPLKTTKEVLVIIDSLAFNYDFLGSPSIVLGFIIDFL